MRYIQGLSPETRKLLTRIYLTSKYTQVRQRAHCLLLSFEGYPMKDITKILGVSRKTIHNWVLAWEERSIVGLYDKKGRGRKPTFSSSQKGQIRLWVKQSPKQLEKVRNCIEKEWGIKVCKETIKRVLKILGLSWHRVRKKVASKPPEENYKAAKQALKELKCKEEKGEIDLRYMDETGFCLTPYLPYAWQEKGEEIKIRTSASKRLNAIGFMNRKNDLDVYIFECKINSEVVIACIDKFCENITKKTVVVIDNAPTHTSNIFYEKIEEWKQKNLEFFFLPTYSPQLNLIEILWRFIKYEWLEVSAYESWKHLVESVENILREFGHSYVINFV